jgi:RecB family exonuclease
VTRKRQNYLLLTVFLTILGFQKRGEESPLLSLSEKVFLRYNEASFPQRVDQRVRNRKSLERNLKKSWKRRREMLMGVTLHSYVRVEEIWRDPVFRSLREQEALFLVPSGEERPYLGEELRGEAFLGSSRSILTWSGLVRFLAERLEEGGLRVALRRQIDPPDHWIILRHLWSRLCAEAPQGALPRGMQHPSFVRICGGVLREMLREDVTSAHLRALWGCSFCTPGEICTRKGEKGSTDPQSWFCWLLGAYENYLKEHRLADSAQVASLGGDLLKRPGAREILAPLFRENTLVLVGFLSFASGQLRLVRELIALGGEVHLWVPSAGLSPWNPQTRQGFYSAGDQLGVSSVSPSLPSLPGRLYRLSGGDAAMTAELLARELALWSLQKGHFGEGEIPFPSWEKIALVAPEEEIPSLEEALGKYRLPYSLMDPLPLGKTPLWGIFRRMLSLALENWPGEDTARLLGHAFFGGKAFPLSRALQQLPRGERGWGEFFADLGDPALEKLWKGMASYGTFLLRGAPPEAILEKTRDFFAKTLKISQKGHEGAEDAEDLDFLVRTTSGILQELERKLLFYRELVPDVGEAAQESLKGGEAVSFLEIWAEETSLLPPPALQKSMLLFRDSPPILFECDYLCWLGVTPSRWPGPSGEAPFLSDQERVSLEVLENPELPRAHLPLSSERRTARHALFRRIIATACKGVLCCSPLQDSRGRPLGESPFLAASVAGEFPWMEEPLPPLKRSLGDLLPLSSEWHFPEVEIPGDLPGGERELPHRRFHNPPEEKGSISRMDAFRDCPFRYHVEGFLEAPAGVFEYEPRKAGSLVHALWEKLFTQGGEACSEERFLQIWEPLVKEKYPELLGPLRRQEALLRYQAYRGIQVLEEAEERLGDLLACREVERDVAFQEPTWKVPFYGRVDRLDFLQGGGVVLVDYKLGQGERYKHSLQLGAYALALQEEGMPLKGWLYFGLRDRKMVLWGDAEVGDLYLGPPKRGRRKLPSPEEQMEEVCTVLDTWGKSLTQGIYPPIYRSKSCSSCPYRTLCRREEVYWKDENDNDNENDNEEQGHDFQE